MFRPGNAASAAFGRGTRTTADAAEGRGRLAGGEGSTCGSGLAGAGSVVEGFWAKAAVDPLLVTSLSWGTARLFSDLSDRRRQSCSCLGDEVVSGDSECVSSGEWPVWS